MRGYRSLPRRLGAVLSFLGTGGAALAPVQASSGPPPMIEVAPTEAIELPSVTHPDFDWLAERAALRWLEARAEAPAFVDFDIHVSFDLVSRLIEFVRRFEGDSEDRVQDAFRAQFVAAISEELPGFAWVLLAHGTRLSDGGIDALREGGGVGVQIPIVGDRVVHLASGQGQVVLRLLPIAGNYESLTFLQPDGTRLQQPGGGIVVRPTAELEASFRAGAWWPGLRFLAQPRLDDPSDTRMLAEVYVRFEVAREGWVVPRFSIVPRCVLDLSTRRATQAVLAGAPESFSCAVSAEVALGG